MGKIDGHPKTVRSLLKGVKYEIDFYQRDYKWGEKQIQDLMDDLTSAFLRDYDESHARVKVADYGSYFLGSVIISKRDGKNFIIDGQQRLTSLTLFLMLLNNLQRSHEDKVDIGELIVSEKYGTQSFNILVEERLPVMSAILNEEPIDIDDDRRTAIYQSYTYLADVFPNELKEQALPYFIDWLQDNVVMIEISADADDDAYAIFETMNDRGLSLSPTEMLKGYLLTNMDPHDRIEAARIWRQQIEKLNNLGKDTDSDFLKNWLRSQYANTIRERKKGAQAEDFDRIGTQYHRWLRDNSKRLGLSSPRAYFDFVSVGFKFYSEQYARLIEASRQMKPGLERVLYNAGNNFTLQYMVLLAPLLPEDTPQIIDAKLRTTATYLDILITRRIWNWHSNAYSTMQYAMFNLTKDIRGLDVKALGSRLYENLEEGNESFDSNDRLYVHQQNAKSVKRILARLTDFVGIGSAEPSRYLEYVSEMDVRYEIEHVWANHFDRHQTEFEHPEDFAEFRNRIGDLLLLPKSHNASYGDLRYEEKWPHYISQNMLARSLNPQCYERNPAFSRFVSETELPFKAYGEFNKSDVEERGALYKEIAKRVWNPHNLLSIANNKT